MTIAWLKELIKDMPDKSPVVMWIQHEDRPEAMAQVSNAMRMHEHEDTPSYLMLTAYEKDIIRDGKLKPTKQPPCVANPDPEFVDVDEFVKIDAPVEVRTHWGPPESTALVAINSNGKPVETRGTSDSQAGNQKIVDAKIPWWLRLLLK